MAELVVRSKYASKLRTATLGLLNVTFPIWGVASPLFVVGFLIFFIVSRGTILSGTTNITGAFCFLISAMAISAVLLPLTRALRDDCLIADRSGLTLPLMLSAGRKRYWPWENVVSAKVTPAVAPSIDKQTLVLITNRGQSIHFALSRLSAADVEQLLLALEMWAPNCDIDVSVSSLKESFKHIDATSSDKSYTNMWEEELRRRFCATAFLPLEPGCGLRNGSLRVIRQLALGGLSALYLCQRDEKTLVVIKEAVVPDDASESVKAKAMEMFEREANLLMKLNHPNIVKVLDCFAENDRHYIMLEYINGQDIRQFVRQNGSQKEHVVVEWAIQVASILKHIHEQDPPIIHRDLTPDNLVLREDGSLVLIDFGAANEFLSKATGTFVGKQSFIAPEQFRGKAIPQSDIYAFGCTLHFLLTGEEPEALSTSSPRAAGATISDDMEDFVVCCTQMEARDRFQTAAQMIPVLKKISASLMVG